MSNPVALPTIGWGSLFSALLTMGRKGQASMSEKHWRFTVSAIDRTHLNEYIRAFKFSDQDCVPLTYLYLMVQRAQLSAMLGKGFPYSAVGMVHTANEMRLLQIIELEAPLEISVCVAEEPATQSGAKFIAFECSLYQAGHQVASCTSRYLTKRRKSNAGKPAKIIEEALPAPSTLEQLEQYVLFADTGRRYAKLSGDYNPIHLWSWSARLLGFARPIIQGMHTAAQVASALERKYSSNGQSLTELNVKFLKPISLPANPQIMVDENSFEVKNGEIKAMHGRFIF